MEREESRFSKVGTKCPYCEHPECGKWWICKKRFLKESGKTKKQIQKENEEAADRTLKQLFDMNPKQKERAPD